MLDGTRQGGARSTVLMGAVLLLMAISLLAVAQSASAESYEEAVEGTTGVAHFWPMGESSGSSFADVVGGANAEVSSSGVTLGEPGGLVEDLSTSAAFDGTSGAAQAKVDLSGTHELTIEFWMKWHAYGADDKLALEFTPNFNHNTGGFLVDPDATPGSDFAVAIGEEGDYNNVVFERPSAEQWHYYTFVIDAAGPAENEITPYVDGRPVSYTKSGSDTVARNFANDTLFWMSRDASALFGEGSMQDLALYDTTLPPSTILEHYALGAHAPQASFTSTPVVATAGVPVHFDASESKSPTGSLNDYAWDFDGSKTYSIDGGGSSSTSHTFSSPGTYTVDLRVKDSLGQMGTISKTVTVGAALPEYEQAVEDTSGISHFWPMGEASGSSFADVFGGANATTSGGVTLGEPGGLVEDSSTSASFDGSSGAADATVNLSNTHQVTIEFWMKWHAFAGDDHLALEFTPNFNENPGGFLVDPDATPGSDFAVAVGQYGAGHNNNVLFERPSAEHWHYYAFVIDTEASGETEITPYVDGHAVSYTKLDEETGAGSFADSTLFWMSRDASTLFGAGSMQDLALYESTLSSSTILEHYERGENTYKVANTTAPSIEGTANEGETLTANHGSWSGLEPISYAYQWQRCSTGAVGREGTGEGQFEHPGAVAIDSAGDLWVADTNNNRVEEFDEHGKFLRQFGSYGTGDSQFDNPDGIAIDPSGDVWVLDHGNDRVEKFDPEGHYLSQFAPEIPGEGVIGATEGIAIDEHGNVWISDTGGGHIVEFNKEGEYLKTVGSPGSEPGQLGETEGLAIDEHGNVWVADWTNNRVEEFSETGEFIKELGSEGEGDGQMSRPFGIAIDAKGDVWVGDNGNNRLDEFSSTGEYLRKVGSQGTGPGEFEFGYPIGVAITSAEDVWVTDSNNNRLEEFSPEGAFLGHPSCEDISGAAGETYKPTSLDVGSQLDVVVKATNASSEASATSETTSIVKAEPKEEKEEPPVSVLAPTITGTTADGQTLTASTGIWIGSEPISYTYQWQRCNESGGECTNISGATSSTYVLASGDVGKTVRVVVAASNSAGSATSESEATGVIAILPSDSSLPSISGTMTDGQTLTASTGTWTGTTPISYGYQWRRCNSSGGSCANISGATSSTYTLEHSDVGATLRVIVEATNSVGSEAATSGASSVVAAQAPSNIVTPSISGEAKEGHTLSAGAGTWKGTPAFTYTYQWQSCNSSGESCANISGATGSTYSLTSANVDSTLRVVVKAENSAGSANATSSVSSIVVGVPVNTAAPEISGTSEEGQTLSASTGSWSGYPAPTYSYQWQTCNGAECADIEDATASTYTLQSTDAGKGCAWSLPPRTPLALRRLSQ